MEVLTRLGAEFPRLRVLHTEGTVPGSYAHVDRALRGLADHLARRGMTPDAVEEKYGVRPGRYPELAALVGETSDNLSGVPGVGPKTACRLIAKYGTLQRVLDSPVIREAVTDHRPTVRGVWYDLATGRVTWL